MTSLISLHCGFPLEEDLGSSSLFTISELQSALHQKAAMAVNTTRRVPGRGGRHGGVGVLLVPMVLALLFFPGEKAI